MADITEAIAGLTDRLHVYRIAYSLNRRGIVEMPPLIEIKGLGASVAAAKKGIADVRAETSGLSVDASALVAAVQDVRTQIKEAHADLKFEAETLGNSNGSEEKLTSSDTQQITAAEVETIKEPPAIQQPGSTASTEPGA